MIFDIIRFNQFALDLLSSEDESEEDISGVNSTVANVSIKYSVKRPQQQSIGEYLDQENYSEAFRNDYLIPMTASVWSTSPDKASLEFPAITLIRFMWNHHLLTTVAARPTWMTILGGSRQYVDAIMVDFPKDRVHLGIGIESLSIQENEQIRLHRNDGKEEIFDHVVLATHGDQAMEIIRDIATPQEKDVMSGFKTSKNTAVLHSDLSVGGFFLVVVVSLLCLHHVPSSKYLASISFRTTKHLPGNREPTPLTIHLANAPTPHRLVLLELYHHLAIPNHPSLRLPHLLDEPSPTHPLLNLRPDPSNIESATSTLFLPHPRILDLPSSTL